MLSQVKTQAHSLIFSGKVEKVEDLLNQSKKRTGVSATIHTTQPNKVQGVGRTWNPVSKGAYFMNKSPQSLFGTFDILDAMSKHCPLFLISTHIVAHS